MGHRRQPRAQALIEFALLLPLIVLLLFTMLDATNLFRSSAVAHNAAEEAAIYYAQNPGAVPSDIEEHVRAAVSGATGDDFELATSNTGKTAQHGYTMRVLTNDGWKTANAKNITNFKTFKATKRFHSYMAQLFGSGDLTASATVTGSSTFEGEAA